MRIVTLTLNPALDVTTEVASVDPDRKLRCEEASTEPGGGGINVARVVRELGGDSEAVVALGGPFGSIVAQHLEDLGQPFEAVEVTGGTRQSFTVLETASGRQYRFVLPGPRMSSEEWDRCLEATVSRAEGADGVVASSSLPPGLPDDCFARLAFALVDTGASVVVDTSGPALRAAIDAPVDLVKPSANELRTIAGRPLHTEVDYESAARDLLAGGRCRSMVISLAAAGALLVPRDGDACLFRAPAVQVRSAVGAGDSMVAAIASALGRGESLAEATRWGVAAGTAAVLTPGTELCRLADVEALLPRVSVSTLPAAG